MGTSEQQQIVDLQSRLAFQEDSVQALSEQLAYQRTEIEKLQIQVSQLHKRLSDATQRLQDVETAPAARRPPHY